MNRTLITVLGVGLILATADLLVLVASLLLLIFAGVLFGIFLNAIANWCAKITRLPYRLWYIIWVALIAAAIVSGISLLGLQIAERAAEFSTALRTAGAELREQMSQYEWMPDVQNFQKVLTEQTGILPGLTQGVQWVTWGITAAAVILFVGLYVAYDPHLYKVGMTKLIPMGQREHVREVMATADSALVHWIIGRLISMAVIGVCTTIALWMFEVPLPITLGILAALLTFIPNIGPVMAAVPQALLALQVDFNTAFYVIVFNLILQGVESYLLTPLVDRYEATLPPALTISAQLVLGTTIGIMGLMMAAPLTVLVMVVVQTLYVRDTLGDPSPGELATEF